jgi:hypothetical protein
MKSCGQKAEIVLGEAKVEQDRRNRHYPQSGSIIHISYESIPINSSSRVPILVDR